MIPLSVLSLLAALAYVLLGLHALSENRRSPTNVVFLLLCLSLAGWALPYAFAAVAPDATAYFRWYQIAEVCACFIPGLLLHFAVLLTRVGPPALRRRMPLIHVAGAAFAARAATGVLQAADVVPTPLGWGEIVRLGDPWTLAFTIYYAGSGLAAVALFRLWGARAAAERERRQARAAFRSGAVTLALVIVSVAVLPAVIRQPTPPIGHLLLLLWAGTIAWAIVRHGMMVLTPAVAAGRIVATMNDALLLVDPGRRVVFANAAAGRLFGCAPAEIVGREGAALLAEPDGVQRDAIRRSLADGPVRGQTVTIRAKDGGARPALVSVTMLSDAEGAGGWVVTLRDTFEQVRAEERLRHLAHHDVLTGLPNRFLLDDRLRQALVRARRYGHAVGVLMLDLDRFKEVNDGLGHEAGDRLLQEVATRLKASIRASDTGARLGGDEFAVVLPELQAARGAEIVARRIRTAFERPVVLDGRDVAASASIGIALYPEHGADAATLLRHADLAMYEAKRAGRNLHRVFTAALGEAALGAWALEQKLRRALDERQFLLHYQPQVAIDGGRVVGVEALLRWQDPDRGLVSPGVFLPAAEETGLIVPIGAWVLRTACAQNAAWRAAGLPPVPVSVNLSARQLAHRDLVETVRAALKGARLAPGDLEVEVAEDALLRHAGEPRANLERLRELGVRVAIDDLGAGHTSLSFLARFRGHTLKVARGLVRRLPGTPADRAIVEGIVALARETGIERVIGEAVEREEQRAVLREAGCDAVQGYGIARPAPATVCARFLADAAGISLAVEGAPPPPAGTEGRR